MIARIRYSGTLSDDTGRTIREYLKRLKVEAIALRVAMQVAIDRGDVEAIEYTRQRTASLTAQLQAIKGNADG